MSGSRFWKDNFCKKKTNQFIGAWQYFLRLRQPPFMGVGVGTKIKTKDRMLSQLCVDFQFWQILRFIVVMDLRIKTQPFLCESTTNKHTPADNKAQRCFVYLASTWVLTPIPPPLPPP